MQNNITPEKRKEGIQTFSGNIVSPVWPNENTINIEDIAHGLGFMCRFAGQCKVFYSVAQHCVIMSRWFRRQGRTKEAKYALIHEAAEGLGMMDMPHPIKYLPQMKPYKLIESTYQTALYRRFGLFDEPPPTVKELDIRICAAEAKVLMNPVPNYASQVDTSDLVIKPYKNINDGKKYFLMEYDLLFGDRK